LERGRVAQTLRYFHRARTATKLRHTLERSPSERPFFDRAVTLTM